MSDDIRWTVNIDGVWHKGYGRELYTIRVIQWKRGLMGWKKKPGWIWDRVGEAVLGADGWVWEWRKIDRNFGAVRGGSKTLELAMEKGIEKMKWEGKRPPLIFKEALEKELPGVQEILDGFMVEELPI